jgi:hypothetical protein
MKVLGDWNWYLPSWLDWLPRIGAEGDAAPPPLDPGEPPAPDEPGTPDEPKPEPLPA